MAIEIKHDSQNAKYRWPQGARPCGSSVRLRLSAPEGSVCTLRLWSNAGERKLPMRLRGDMDGSCLYEVQLPLPQQPVILWYTFMVVTGGQLYWYGNNSYGQGGVGQISEHLPPSYQITVYDKNYTVPSWMHDGIMYQIFVDRFCDGGAPLLSKKPGLVTHKNWNDLPNEYSNKPLGPNLGHDFFGGNLNGIIEKLPYLKSLGVTVLYLNPIFDAQSNHKYDTGDYTHVDPTFGTNEDFVRLCKAARSQGIRVMLDGQDVGYIVYPPYQLVLDVAPGRHELALTVLGHRENAFGPLHKADDADKWIGPDAWRTKGNRWTDNYRVIPLGLRSAPTIEEAP